MTAAWGLGLVALGYGTQSGSSALGVGTGTDKDDKKDDEEVPSVPAASLSEVLDGVDPSAAQIPSEMHSVLLEDRAVPGETAATSSCTRRRRRTRRRRITTIFRTRRSATEAATLLWAACAPSRYCYTWR